MALVGLDGRFIEVNDSVCAILGRARDELVALTFQDFVAGARRVGRQLLTICPERYRHVRQKVLLTDDDVAQQRFYESLGYVNTTSFTGASLNAYVRFNT
jgi:PAS domain-containing protein